MRRLPPLNALRVFEAAARRASFSATAEALCVTHSAVSHQIALLEQWLGCELFVRYSSGIRLSAAGQALLQVVGEALATLEAGCATIAAEAQGVELVLGAPGSFLANWLIPRLARFEIAHPDIRLRLQTCSGEEDLLRGKIDALIASCRTAPRGIAMTALFDEQIGPVCAPGGSLSKVGDLAGQTLLHTASRLQAWPEWAQAQGLDAAGFTRGRQFDHLALMLEAAAAGIGLAIAPALLVERELAQGRLVAPLGFASSGASFSLCLPSSRRAEKPLMLLRDWLQKEAAGQD